MVFAPRIPMYFGPTTGGTGIVTTGDDKSSSTAIEAGFGGSVLFLISGHAGLNLGYNINERSSYTNFYTGIGYMFFLIDIGATIPLSDSSKTGFLSGLSFEWPFDREAEVSAVQMKIWYVNFPEKSTTFSDQLNIGVSLFWNTARWDELGEDDWF